MRFRLRFGLRTLFVVVAIAGMVSAFVARSLYWVHERAALTSLFWTDDPPITAYTEANVDAPPKTMPLLWRLFGAKPYSMITIRQKVEEGLFQRFVAAFPEADVHRHVGMLEFIDIQHINEDQPSAPTANHGLGGGGF